MVMDRHDRKTTFDQEAHVDDRIGHQSVGVAPPGIEDWSSFTDGDATPDISTGSYWKEANTSPTTITNFDSPKPNIHKITILFTTVNTTIQNNANIVIQAGSDFAGEVDDVKVFLWDGTNWVEQPSVANQLIGVTYFPHDSDASDIGGYDTLERSPSDHGETTHVTNVSSSDGDVAIEEFITDAGDPGATAVIAGVWEFHVHAFVDNTLGTTNLKLEVYKRTTGGSETLIFSTEREINATSATEFEWSYVQATDTVLNLTDRLVVKFLCNTTSVPQRTVTTYYEGTDRTAHIHAPVTASGGSLHAKHLIFNLWNPNAIQADDNEVCLWPEVDSALTISKITVTLHAAANEVAGDLKYADTFISLANPVVINTFDTTSGVLEDSSITSGSVAAGKCIYLSFDSAPNVAITQMSVDIAYTYD